VVAPFFNEKDALAELLRRLGAVASSLEHAYRFEFVFVDDGSRDGSLEIARDLTRSDPRLRVVELRRNYGQTAALQAGLDVARGDIVISMDADLQHFPEEIPRFLEELETGYDVVCGWRRDRQEGIKRRWPSRVANRLIRRISGLEIHDVGTTYRAYRAEIVHDLQLLGEHHRFVPVFAKLVGARIGEIPIQNIERLHGQSNYGLKRTWNVLMDLTFLYFITRFADRPIRIFGSFSAAAFGLGALIAVALGVEFALTGRPVVRDRSGWFLLGSLLLLTSLQLLLTGLLAEFLARIYFNTSDRRPYQVRQIWPIEPS
jgi:glycosyltransferase involved in cell wall biosynthesis